MGSGSSKGSMFSLCGLGNPSSPHHRQYTYNTPQHHHAPLPYSYGTQTPQRQRNLDSRYSRIADNYQTLEQVTDALAHAGLESSNVIVGIDFTKSNEWTGSRSFHRRSLHHIGKNLNPYEEAISIIGQTLSTFDEDNLIPCFGFGDVSTQDREVFSFYTDRYCNGFEEVLARYREIVPNLPLAGPTSFAPIIEMATTIVEESRGQYHVLLIIADGQVTRSIDSPRGQLSYQEKNTIDAIVNASNYPLSIILVGVGDGPWDMMKEFDDNLPARKFDNFQFVNFTEIMAKNVDWLRKQTEFALASLMEIPSQYKATLDLDMLGRQTGHSLNRAPLPPPIHNTSYFSNDSKPNHKSSFEQSRSTSPKYEYSTSTSATNAPPISVYDNQVCPICLTNSKDMAFNCGHQTCCDCGESLEQCPICRGKIKMRLKLF